jgi:hypothetical protein
MSGGEKSKKNFLTDEISDTVTRVIEERNDASGGEIEKVRLYNNLLSSQPLCFNFFGELQTDKYLALKFLQQYWPELTKVTHVFFEYAPPENYTRDNSAFDVAFEVMADHRRGFIGLECKYTDTFSSKVYDKLAYREIFDKSEGNAFTTGYEKIVSSRYNQLFRNQLIAAAFVQNGDYDFSNTGLFCHQDDKSALQIAEEFKGHLKMGEKRFKIITFKDFIEKIQLQNISWEQRELSMLLWARYCGKMLSEHAFK